MAEDFFRGHVVGDEGIARLAEEDKPHRAAQEFFIFLEGLKDRVCRDVGGEGEREVEAGEGGEDADGIALREPGFFDRDPAGGDEAERDCLAVEEPPVAGGIFDPVPDRVTEVEEGADAEGFKFVFGDDRRLDRDVSRDERGDVVEGVEEREIADRGMFDNLGEALVVITFRQGREGISVGDYQPGLMEGADEVFSAVRIDAGFFLRPSYRPGQRLWWGVG